jgi:PilZ domain
MSESQVYTASPRNRRRARRCLLVSQARVECRKGAGGLGRNLTLNTLDVSETGARLTVSVPLTCGQEVDLQLIAPGFQKPVRRGGKVVWSVGLDDERYAVGVAFDRALPYADLQRVARA